MRRSFTVLIVSVIAVGELAACSSNASGTATSTSTAAAPQLTSVTTTTVVPREQVIPARTRYVVDGRTVDLVCKGRGRIPVVFQAGGRDAGEVWNGLIKALGSDVFTCVFDRPDTAFAGDVTTPPELLTPRIIERTLAETLEQAGVGPRVILVGHDVGGMDSIVFGADHRNAVAGAVLFDPDEPAFFHTQPADVAELRRVGFDVGPTAAQLAAVASWPDVPLVVLTADPATQKAGWTTYKRIMWAYGGDLYARLSPQGAWREVAGSNHDVYESAPRVALSAIQGVIRRAEDPTSPTGFEVPLIPGR